MKDYKNRITMLTDRAKQNSRYTKDLDIGESCYLLSLINLIQSFRMKLITREELVSLQSDLKANLENIISTRKCLICTSPFATATAKFSPRRTIADVRCAEG